MWQNAHDAYLESRILSASPLELVRLLYQACTGEVREARRYLAEGDIAARCRCISRAHCILTELALSLDHERGGELSTRLARLYDYMQRRLLEANFRQEDAPLSEVLGLLATLGEAWSDIGHAGRQIPETTTAWQRPPAGEPIGARHAAPGGPACFTNPATRSCYVSGENRSLCTSSPATLTAGATSTPGRRR